MALPRAKLGVSLFRHPCRKPLSPGKAVYAWLALRPCKALGHTRPASMPGLSVGLPPLDQARMLAVSHTKPLHNAVAQMADDLYGGFAPKQGCFGCLPKVLHDAKPTEQATLDIPIFINDRDFSIVCNFVFMLLALL